MTCQLLANRQLSDLCVDFLESKSSVGPEEAARHVAAIANFEWKRYGGCLSNPALERLLVGIAQNLPGATRVRSTLPRQGNGRRILHVATEVYGVGGHTRVLSRILRADYLNSHHVVVTGQKAQFPRELFKDVRSDRVRFSSLSPGPLVERSIELRKLSLEDFDVVVLHQHPDDVVPTLAFSFEGCPPIVLFNHADHVFGLGVSVTDLVCDFRRIAMERSIRDRFARRTSLLPLPVDQVCSERHPKKSSCFGTSVSKYKVAGRDGVEFLGQLSSLQDTVPDSRLEIVGLCEDDRELPRRTSRVADIRWYGVVPDPDQIIRRWRVFVEPFPIGSGLALLDNVARGALPLFSYRSANIYGVGGWSLFDNLEHAPPLNPQAHRSHFVRLMQDDQLCIRFLEQLRDSISSCHGKSWLSQWWDIVDDAASQRHEVIVPAEQRMSTSAPDCEYADWCTRGMSGASRHLALIKTMAVPLRSGLGKYLVFRVLDGRAGKRKEVAARLMRAVSGRMYRSVL